MRELRYLRECYHQSESPARRSPGVPVGDGRRKTVPRALGRLPALSLEVSVMQARCRKPLIWTGLFLLLALVSWGRAWGAEAKTLEIADLFAAQDETCPDGTAVATLDTPDWLQAAPPASGAAPSGKSCETNKTCGSKKYCSKAVGDCKGRGECKGRPEVCPEIFKPVCGCNNKTYSNDCFAAMAGVNVASEGACKGAEKACQTNKQCKAGNYCAKDTGQCDAEGVCAQRPQICPFVVAPVCGCNNKTYNNGCLAHRAGVNIKHDGKC